MYFLSTHRNDIKLLWLPHSCLRDFKMRQATSYDLDNTVIPLKMCTRFSSRYLHFSAATLVIPFYRFTYRLCATFFNRGLPTVQWSDEVLLGAWKKNNWKIEVHLLYSYFLFCMICISCMLCFLFCVFLCFILYCVFFFILYTTVSFLWVQMYWSLPLGEKKTTLELINITPYH
jgi:hypothetical protein